MKAIDKKSMTGTDISEVMDDGANGTAVWGVSKQSVEVVVLE